MCIQVAASQGDRAHRVLSQVIAGACIGGVMAYASVKVLAGVFDPPPEGLTVPRLYLVFLFVSATSLTAAVVAAHLQDLQSKSVIGELRSDV